MLSPYRPYNKPAFLALIPPSFTSVNPFNLWRFSERCNPILAVTTGESMRISGSTPTLSIIYRKCSHAKQAAHTKSSRLSVASEWVKKISVRSWVELHFTTISYILSFNYSYRYEINLIRIMYTANSSILYSKEKTVRILGTWHHRGTQREYSSKPLKHSIVKRILVFKR